MSAPEDDGTALALARKISYMQAQAEQAGSLADRLWERVMSRPTSDDLLAAELRALRYGLAARDLMTEFRG